MHTTAPHPELFTRIAALIAALRVLVFGAVPQLFSGISKDTSARIAAATAMLRRYLHVLAADITLPPLKLLDSESASHPSEGEVRTSRTPLLRLTEELYPTPSSGGGDGEDSPALHWAMIIARLRQLSEVLHDPARHARRLARIVRLRGMICLKPAPLRWHQIRRLPPEVDALLCRLDQAARPEMWAGIGHSPDTS